MATQILNQATLTYHYGESTGTASSNVATTTLQGPLTVTKSSLSTEYRPGEELTYMLTLSNGGSVALSNVVIVDDLGTYTIAGPVSVTPLTYLGPSKYYVNGVYVTDLTPVVAAHSMTYTIAALAAGANAIIMYKAVVNDYALADLGGVMSNLSAVTATGLTETIYATYTMVTEDFADVRIVKCMSPDPVTDGNILTYSFTLYNYGNMDATNVVLTDTFSPAPTGISVTVDGTPVAATEYDYVAGVFTLPGATATITLTVPAATFTQDPATGLITTSPGTMDITVSGTI